MQLVTYAYRFQLFASWSEWAVLFREGDQPHGLTQALIQTVSCSGTALIHQKRRTFSINIAAQS